jgi:hypothetical protein
MSLKGFPSQAKDLGGENIKDGSGNVYEFPEVGQIYQTIQPIGGEKYASDSIIRGLGLVGSDTAEAGSTKRIIKATGHSAQLYDHIRYKSSDENLNFECVIIGVPDADTIILAAQLPIFPSVGDSFEIYRSVTLTISPTTGSLEVTSAPLDQVDSIDPIDYGDGIPIPMLITSEASYNIPARDNGNPLEIVASLASRARKVEVMHDIGYLVGLYTGTAGAETLLKVLPLTPDFTMEIDIPAGTRLSLRALDDSAELGGDISTGKLSMNFLG